MTDIDEAIDDVRDAATDFLNGEGRSASHVVAGVIITAGFALLASGIASSALKSRTAKRRRGGAQAIAEQPQGAFSLILPAVFSATTLSAVRVWNAPPARERTAALGLWAAAQTVNAVWLGLRPASMWKQVLAAMSSAGLAAAFAYEARKLNDAPVPLPSPRRAARNVRRYLHRKADQVSDRFRTLH